MGSRNLEQNFKLLSYLDRSRKQLKESFSLTKVVKCIWCSIPQVMTAGPPFLRSIPGWLTVAIRKALGMWINLWFIHQKLCPSVIQQLPSPQPWWWENPTVKILKSIGISSAQHSRQNCVSSSALSKGKQKQRECHHLPQGWPVVGSREDQDMHSGGTAARCEKISFSMEWTSSQAPLDRLHTSPHCCALLQWVSVPCVAPHWLSEH